MNVKMTNRKIGGEGATANSEHRNSSSFHTVVYHTASRRIVQYDTGGGYCFRWSKHRSESEPKVFSGGLRMLPKTYISSEKRAFDPKHLSLAKTLISNQP